MCAAHTKNNTRWNNKEQVAPDWWMNEPSVDLTTTSAIMKAGDTKVLQHFEECLDKQVFVRRLLLKTAFHFYCIDAVIHHLELPVWASAPPSRKAFILSCWPVISPDILTVLLTLSLLITLCEERKAIKQRITIIYKVVRLSFFSFCDGSSMCRPVLSGKLCYLNTECLFFCVALGKRRSVTSERLLLLWNNSCTSCFLQ